MAERLDISFTIFLKQFAGTLGIPEHSSQSQTMFSTDRPILQKQNKNQIVKKKILQSTQDQDMAKYSGRGGVLLRKSTALLAGGVWEGIYHIGVISPGNSSVCRLKQTKHRHVAAYAFNALGDRDGPGARRA